MPDILHRIGVNASPNKVYKALSTIDGLRHWWTTETKGKTQRGGIINFGFCKMKVLESNPGKLVHWQCVGGPKEWLGTEITFNLVRKQRQTFVLFKHAGWPAPVEFMHHCSTKWAVFLFSLRNWLERGEGSPAPFDTKIHLGD